MLSFKKFYLLICIITCQLQANNWELKQKLSLDNPKKELIEFGFSIKLSADGDTLIVGSPDYNATQGAAWIFQKQKGSWNTEGDKIMSTDIQKGTYQGWNVGISDDGTRIATGGVDKDCVKVWIFERNIKKTGPKWIQMEQPLISQNKNFTEGPGLALALSGNGEKIAMGNPADSNNKGYTTIYAFDGLQWNAGPKIIGADINNATYQGFSVALSYDGSILAVGAPDYDKDSSGGVFVFKCSGITCIQEGKKLVGSDVRKNSRQGYSVALSRDGKTLAFGSGPYSNNPNGAVWVFIYSGQWIQQGKKLVGLGAIDGAQQGSSIALSNNGNILLIGGQNDNKGVGATWKFIRTGEGLWIQDGEKIVAPNSVTQGSAVALSADGNIAAIGAPNDPFYSGHPNISDAVLIYGPKDSSSRETYMTYWLPPLLAIAAGIITFGLKYMIKKHCCRTDDSALPTHIKLSDPLVMVETHRGSFA